MDRGTANGRGTRMVPMPFAVLLIVLKLVMLATLAMLIIQVLLCATACGLVGLQGTMPCPPPRPRFFACGVLSVLLDLSFFCSLPGMFGLSCCPPAHLPAWPPARLPSWIPALMQLRSRGVSHVTCLTKTGQPKKLKRVSLKWKNSQPQKGSPFFSL